MKKIKKKFREITWFRLNTDYPLPHYTLSSSKVHLVPKSVTDSVEVTSHATLNWFQNAKKRIGNLEVGVAISKKRFTFMAQHN